MSATFPTAAAQQLFSPRALAHSPSLSSPSSATNPPFFKKLFVFYKPTGPLSGVTTSAIVVWLVVWFFLHRRWSWRMVAMRQVSAAALILLILALLLTFPPIADLF